MVTGALKARLKPRPARARSKQARSGCSHAPRPGSLRSGSGTTSPSTLAKRRSSAWEAAPRQPTHVLPRPRGLPVSAGGLATGLRLAAAASPRSSGLADDVGVLALERLV